MATNRRFVAKNGLDNNNQSITNLGASGADLTRSGAHSLTLTTTATTTATLPTGTVTLAKNSGETMTNLTLSGTLTAGGGAGTNGQVLQSTGTGVQWATVSGGGSIDGSGAANKLAIWSDADTLTSDTNLHWDTTNDRLGIGTSTPRSGLEAIQTSATPGIGLTRPTADANGAQLQLRKSRGTDSSPTIVSSGDTTATIAFAPYNGTSFAGRASITSYVDGTPDSGTSSVPSSLDFRTGSESADTRMTIRSSGKVAIGGFTHSAVDSIDSQVTIGATVYSEHIRFRYDTSNYASIGVSSTGVTTLDASGTNAKFVFSDAVEVPDNAYGSGWDGSTAVPTRNAVYDIIEKYKIQSFVIAASDETTALTTGTNKVKFRMPYAFTLTGVRASLSTAQTSGNILTVDINESGTSILSTKLTIDNTETTSTTAVTAPVISDSSLADDAEISIDIDQIGDSTAKGLKVTLIGFRT